MAVAHLELDQSLIKHEMVGCMVDWKKVDGLGAASPFYGAYACGAPFDGRNDDASLPVFLHYCQNHALGDFSFTKRRVPLDVLDGDAPRQGVPPDLLRNASAFYDGNPATLRCGGRCGGNRRVEATRAAFTICAMESALAGARLRWRAGDACRPP